MSWHFYGYYESEWGICIFWNWISTLVKNRDTLDLNIPLKIKGGKTFIPHLSSNQPSHIITYTFIVHNWTLFLCSLDVGNKDDQCRGPSTKEKDHLVGWLTSSWVSSIPHICQFWYTMVPPHYLVGKSTPKNVLNCNKTVKLGQNGPKEAKILRSPC